MNVLALHHVHYAYRPDRPVLTGINLALDAGQCLGLLGPNGAGKTTLMRLASGLLAPQQGRVELFGRALRPSDVRWHPRVGTLIERPPLIGHLSGLDNLRMYCRYLDLPDARAHALLELTGMAYAARERVWGYSTGMKQRLGLAQALVSDPDLLLLDEPTNGLDPEGIASVRQLIVHLRGDLSKTLVVSSHLLHEIERTCTHAAVLYRGALRWQGPMPHPGALEQLYLTTTAVDHAARPSS